MGLAGLVTIGTGNIEARRNLLRFAAGVLMVLLVILLLRLNPPTRWASYEYIGPGADAFHDAETGDGYRVDDAGWTIDWPEDPDSVLALVTYPSWTGGANLDLTGKRAEITLRGEDLDLYGGHATFWVLDDSGRCHHRQPLAMGTTVLDLDDWHRSWTRAEPAPCSLNRVHSYGIGFIGFSQEPSGALILEELTFR